MKNLLVVSHCILNNAAKVEQDEAELAEEYKIREELMQLILKKDVQLLNCLVRNLLCMDLRDGDM